MTIEEQKRVVALAEAACGDLGISQLEFVQNQDLPQLLDLIEGKKRNKEASHA